MNNKSKRETAPEQKVQEQSTDKDKLIQALINVFLLASIIFQILTFLN